MGDPRSDSVDRVGMVVVDLVWVNFDLIWVFPYLPQLSSQSYQFLTSEGRMGQRMEHFKCRSARRVLDHQRLLVKLVARANHFALPLRSLMDIFLARSNIFGPVPRGPRPLPTELSYTSGLYCILSE